MTRRRRNPLAKRVFASMLAMRAPSRSMPPVRTRPKTWRAKAGIGGVAAIFLSAMGYLAVAHPLATALGMLLLTLCVKNATEREKHKRWALARSRTGESICQFARSFNARATDTWVIRAMYEETQAVLAHDEPRVPLRASDRLVDIGIDADELDMHLAPRIADRACRSLDNTASNPFFGKVKTLSDLVMFFDAQPARAAEVCR